MKNNNIDPVTALIWIFIIFVIGWRGSRAILG